MRNCTNQKTRDLEGPTLNGLHKYSFFLYQFSFFILIYFKTFFNSLPLRTPHYCEGFSSIFALSGNLVSVCIFHNFVSIFLGLISWQWSLGFTSRFFSWRPSGSWRNSRICRGILLRLAVLVFCFSCYDPCSFAPSLLVGIGWF